MATKAQKENQARFKAVQAEAKKLKAKNPKLAHTQAVKQAWAILSPKSGNKKAPAKKAAPKKKIGAVKAKAPVKKKTAAKKKVAPKSLHKDTQSHNVSIKVMSGVLNNSMKQYHEAQKKLIILEKEQYNLELIKKDIKYIFQNQPKDKIKKFLDSVKKHKLLIKEQKQHIKELKKLI